MRFKELLEMQSSRLDSKAMWEYLIRELKELPDVLVQVEEVEDKIKGVMKNIFVTKGNSETYPTYVCHTDTVHIFHENVQAFCKNNIWYCLNFTENSVEQVGTGGDDKVGIWACYQMLKHLPACKAIFFAFEESGCVGSGASEFVEEFTENSRYLIQIDRTGNSGIVCTGAATKIASNDFEEALKREGEAFGYSPIHNGGMTDVVTLHKNQSIKVAAVNLECGYYKPHSKQEVINVTDVDRVLKFCHHIGTTLTDVYPHIVPKVVYNYSDNRRFTQPNYQNNSKKTETTKEEKIVGAISLGSIDCFECGKPSIEPFHAECIEKATGIKRNCLGCKIRIETNDLYCDTCEVCEICKILLVKPEEYDLGMCYKCLKNAYGKCEMCGADVTSISEMDEGLCNKCFKAI